MTVPYPHPSPVPGSNQIGQFQIGVSPIGDISPFDFWTTCLSQYANSPILIQLISNLAQYVDQTANFDAFYDSIWNLDTAFGTGLDIWGRILGVSRTLAVGTTSYLGFEEPLEPTIFTPFGQAPLYSGGSISESYTLSDTAYRTLLFAKALANICDGTIPSINQLLLNLFPNRGNCYIVDGENLTMTYTFNFPLTSVELAIVQSSGVLPRTSGVLASVVQI